MVQGQYCCTVVESLVTKPWPESVLTVSEPVAATGEMASTAGFCCSAVAVSSILTKLPDCSYAMCYKDTQ